MPLVSKCNPFSGSMVGFRRKIRVVLRNTRSSFLIDFSLAFEILKKKALLLYLGKCLSSTARICCIHFRITSAFETMRINGTEIDSEIPTVSRQHHLRKTSPLVQRAYIQIYLQIYFRFNLPE